MALVECIGSPIYGPNGLVECEIDDALLSGGSGSDPLAVIDQLVQLISALVATPTEAELGVAFFAAFSLPILCYLSAWALSKVVNFF